MVIIIIIIIIIIIHLVLCFLIIVWNNSNILTTFTCRGFLLAVWTTVALSTDAFIRIVFLNTFAAILTRTGTAENWLQWKYLTRTQGIVIGDLGW